MSSESDINITGFCDATGATPDVARDYLEVSDNNVNLAVTLYFENGGKSLKSTSAEDTLTASNEGSTSGGDAVTSDEALARQLQDQEESRRRPQPEEVRAPIAPRTEILAGGDGFDFGYGGGIGAGTGHYGGLLGPHIGGGRRQQQHDSRPSVFNQGDSSSINPSLDILHGISSGHHSSASASNSSSPSPSASHNDSRTHSPTSIAASAKAKRLADLFRPPFDIMFRGGFEAARATAREQNKWLLVNVQDPTEFACQVLNRDLWSDGFVKDIVRESFVFLQYANESPEGKRYLTLYPVQHYPYVAIIDSRTGELAKSWEKQLSPTDFMMEVTEFLEHHSPEAGKSVTMKKPRQTLSDMSEEEQLNAAIAASLNPKAHDFTASSSETTANQSTSTPTTTIDEQEDSKMESDDDKQDNHDDSAATSILDSILPVKRTETTDMANSTRIQFRMADGSRVIRRFLKTDPVRHLFEFIKSEVPETQGQAFELVFNRQQLIDVLDQEIQQAGLQNAAVNVQFA